MGSYGFLAHIHPPRLDPERTRFTHTFCLGGLALVLFLVLGVTGVVLMFSYVPTAEGAARFFAAEAGDLPFAWYLRRLHFLAGQAMVVVLVLHMIRVIISGAYLPPRAANWLVGLGLMLLVLALDFSGYLLRWDQAMRSAAAVAANLIGQVPLVGGLLKRLLLGGEAVGEAGLLRMYVLHCLGLPVMTLVLTMYHFWRIRKDGRPLGGL